MKALSIFGIYIFILVSCSKVCSLEWYQNCSDFNHNFFKGTGENHFVNSKISNDNSNSLEWLRQVITNIKPLMKILNERFAQDEGILKMLEQQLNIPEDANLPITSLINKNGYPVEVHEVVTEDGYKLTMHRIPSGRNADRGSKQPVLVIHGYLCSSDDWITTGPDMGLPYILADAGYDTWIGNVRGNKHGRKHIKLSPEQREFWDFHLDEIGIYDLPAMIDYILKESGERRLHFIGHSQGTTVFFIMCASRPEYNEKIRLMSALGPVGNGWCSHSPLLLEWINDKDVDNLKTDGAVEFPPYRNLFRTLGKLLCGDNMATQIFCLSIIKAMDGEDRQLNHTLLPVIMSHAVSGSSVGQITHYMQILRHGKMTHFDFGPQENIRRYGRMIPPKYDFKKITAPVMLFYGKNDIITSPATAPVLRDSLANAVGVHYVKYSKFSHLNFMWANNAKEMVYKVLLKKMKHY